MYNILKMLIQTDRPEVKTVAEELINKVSKTKSLLFLALQYKNVLNLSVEI